MQITRQFSYASAQHEIERYRLLGYKVVSAVPLGTQTLVIFNR